MVHWLTEVWGSIELTRWSTGLHVGSIADHKKAHWLTEMGRSRITRRHIGSQRWVDCRSQDGTLAH